MKIRTAKLNDIEAIIPVFMDYEKASEDYLSDKYKCMRSKKKPLKKYIRLALKQDIQRENAKFLVIVEKDKIIGYIFGEIRNDEHPLFKRPKGGELSDVAVLKKYRGKGIATKLWSELKKWFVKNKCETITLSVNMNSKAQELYKKWGFENFYLRMIKKI